MRVHRNPDADAHPGFRPANLAARVGWHSPLPALAGRMRCTHCGSKGAARIIARATLRPPRLPKNPH
jgi:hypothetical protein